jgi:hypothetical protein
LPALKTRVKIDLARLQVQVFEYAEAAQQQRLFFKERFLPASHPDQGRMAAVSAVLRSRGLAPDRLGPNEATVPADVDLPTMLQAARAASATWRSDTSVPMP